MAKSILNGEPDPDEHYENDEDRWAQRMAARAWAILSLVVGALLIIVAMFGTKSEAIYLMDKVVRLDTAGPFGSEMDGASHVLTTMSLVQLLLFVGLLVVVTSLLGITATQGRHKCMAAIYAFASASCAGVMLMMSMQILQRIQVTQPMMGRQVQHLCDATTYIQLGSALHCHWASKYGEVPPCGASCSWKVAILEKGCWLMPELCESFSYDVRPVENCTSTVGLAAGSQPLVSSLSSGACRKACDADIKCKDFAHSSATTARPEVCLLFSGTVQLHKAPEWALVQPSQVPSYLQGETSCWQRADPMVLTRFGRRNLLLAISTIVLALVLAVSAWSAFNLMYNMHHRRRNKPNAWQLGLLMCCPCLGPHRKFQTMQLSDESSDES